MANYQKSIYNVGMWNSITRYYKDDVVLVKSDIGDSGIPKNLRYYYALKESVGQNPETANEPNYSSAYWGGYTTQNGEMIPYFLWTPSYNLSTNHSPRVNSVVFGNGYEQRKPDGIYSGLIKMDVSFEMRNENESLAILQFLKTQRGVHSFAVKNLPEIYADYGYKKRFVCPTFNSNFTFHNNYTLKTSFVETNN